MRFNQLFKNGLHTTCTHNPAQNGFAPCARCKAAMQVQFRACYSAAREGYADGLQGKRLVYWTTLHAGTYLCGVLPSKGAVRAALHSLQG